MTNDGVGLPVRLHDLLLALAGRVDDDALSQARELLAVAELDRAVELVVGCLLAGRMPVTTDERHQITWLLDELRSEPALADGLLVVESVPVPRHRFTVESDPTDGMADALGRAISVLPDVRSVRCVWRSTAAGATQGPLPQRVVVVDIGPKGFAPATAYRIDSVLRRVGVRAAVEVLRPGTQLSEYHAAAVTTAREVHFAETTQAQVSAHSEPEAAWFDGPEDVRAQAPVVEPTPVPDIVETGSEPQPSRRARKDSFESDSFGGGQPFPPKPVKRIPVRDAVEAEEELPVEEFTVEELPVEEAPAEVVAAPVVKSNVEPFPIRAEVTAELGPDDLAALQAALADPKGLPPGHHISVEVSAAVDAKLSDRERALLQQLHEELAQREQAAPKDPATSNGSGRWQVDRSGGHNAFQPVNGNNGHPPFPPAG